jgi:hypothetical protein
MPQTFQLRRGTTAEWVFANPILQAGEMGYETSTNRIKIGTGVDPWSSLLYVESSADSVDWSNVDNKPAAFAPSTHASTHETGGVDPITPGGIGAAPTTNPTFTGVITVPAGDPAAPAIVASGDSNTGLSFATDTLIFSTDGAERLRVDSSGNVGIGTGGAALTRPLQVNQGSSEGYFAGGVWYAAHTGNGDCGFAFVRSSSAKWSLQNDYSDGDNFHIREGGFGGASRISIERATGNVGIGRTSPASALDVNGVITVSDKIVHSGDSNTAIRFPAADTFTIETDGVERVRVDSSGRVGIGRTPNRANTSLELDEALFAPATDNYIGGVSIGVGDASQPAIQFDGTSGTGIFRPAVSNFAIATGGTERVRVKPTGSVRFVPLAADPSTGNEAGDVYYNSTSNKLRVYNGTSWIDLH